MSTPAAAWPPELRRVVLVAPRMPEASGGAVVAETYAQMFAAAGLEVEIISLYPGTRAASYAPTVVIRRERLHRQPVIRGSAAVWQRLWLLPLVAFKRVDRTLALRRFRHRMASYSSDTVVVFTHVAGLALLDEAGHRWRPDRPLLIGQEHSPFIGLPEEPPLRGLIVRHFAHVDAFTALSRADAQEFAAILPVPCFALPNPVSLTGVDGPSALEATGDRVAVSLGRYVDEKQLDLMIGAFAAVTRAPELRHWRLELYGWGPEEERLEAAIVEADAEERIRLMGSVDDVRPVLARASCNLLTSRNEGFGMSVLEAAQCGVPSVAFGSAPGLVELLTAVHGRTVLPSGDQQAFETALREVLGDEPALAARGAQARAGARAYSREAVFAAWCTILGRAAADRAGAP